MAALMILLVILPCSVSAAATGENDKTIESNGEYTVIALDPSQPIPDGPGIDNTGAEGTITFWQLPLWIQVSYVTSALLAVLVAYKFIIPLFQVKFKKRKSAEEEEVLRYIKENPGSNMSRVSKDKGISYNSVKYYFGNLIRDNKITITRLGKFSHAYPNTAKHSDRKKVIIAYLNNPVLKNILSCIPTYPGISNNKLAEMTGVKENTMSGHLAKLRDDGLIRFEPEGRNKKYYLNDEVKNILDDRP